MLNGVEMVQSEIVVKGVEDPVRSQCGRFIPYCFSLVHHALSTSDPIDLEDDIEPKRK